MKFIQILFLLFMMYAVTACSKITETNYAKIKVGMSLREVVRILGKPVHADNIDLAGIVGTTAIWTDKKTEITIQFFNDKVAIKNYSTFDDNSKPVEIDVDA